MNYTLLQDEISNDPAMLGYSTYLPDSPGRVIELLNTQSQTMVKPKMITARGIMSSYGIGTSAGAVFLDKLDALSASIPALKWAMKFLQQDAGIDIGDSATQQMLDSLVGVGGITLAEVSGVKAIALQPSSRFEILYGAGKQAKEEHLRLAGVI